MSNGYSRLGRVEERRNKRAAFIFGVLTLAAGLGLLFFGLPALAKFASFISDLRKSSAPVEVNDTTPPAPPRINDLPEATNKSQVDITGSTEPGASVTLFLNSDKLEVVANNDGIFSFSVTLKKGENTINAQAKDRSGNESQKSSPVSITFDNEPPKIDIQTPKSGAEFFGSRQRQITIQGTTESGATLTINDRLVKVEDNGSFLFLTSLSEGDNSFNLKATDKAGNTSEKTISVRFTL